MKTNSKLGYCLFNNIEINDPEKLEEYKSKVVQSVEKFGGKYLSIGGSIRKVEGNWNPQYIVMIEFPSYELANQWYDSSEYADLKALRNIAGKYDGVIFHSV
ncbi:DUF1330 domain-containing protein [Geojedonia litorea]|uniref:DUF1330 domain-containing protein n=1 Tax=Geojedonia litorea TaxID=1268269 RepID=A0ABV9MXU5_9FLAO